ncbi:MAG: cation:dicarboxylate symporter family transporter, partial [Caulobacter sp.]
MNKRFAYLIIASMILGVLVGWTCNQFLDPAGAKSAADNLSIITDIFLRLIKMIIAPLV